MPLFRHHHNQRWHLPGPDWPEPELIWHHVPDPCRFMFELGIIHKGNIPKQHVWFIFRKIKLRSRQTIWTLICSKILKSICFCPANYTLLLQGVNVILEAKDYSPFLTFQYTFQAKYSPEVWRKNLRMCFKKTNAYHLIHVSGKLNCLSDRTLYHT